MIDTELMTVKVMYYIHHMKSFLHRESDTLATFFYSSREPRGGNTLYVLIFMLLAG